MSCKALDWATESLEIRSPTRKFILHLSRQQSRRRFLVLSVDLHSRGRIRRWSKHGHASTEDIGSHRLHHSTAAVPRFRSSVVHPLTSIIPKHPIWHPVPIWDPPVPKRDGGDSRKQPPRGARSGPLNPHMNHQPNQGAEAMRMLKCSARSLADRAARCRKLIPAIESALAFGWTPTSWSPIFRVTRAVSEPPGSCLDGPRIYRPPPHAPARPPSRAVANAKTNTRARSPSPCPTAPKQQRSAPDVAHRRDERRITPIHTRRR